MLPCDAPSFRGRKKPQGLPTSIFPHLSVPGVGRWAFPTPGVHAGALAPVRRPRRGWGVVSPLLFLPASANSLDPRFLCTGRPGPLLLPTHPGPMGQQALGPHGTHLGICAGPPPAPEPCTPSSSPWEPPLAAAASHPAPWRGSTGITPKTAPPCTLPIFPGERPGLLPAQGVPDVLWERHMRRQRLSPDPGPPRVPAASARKTLLCPLCQTHVVRTHLWAAARCSSDTGTLDRPWAQPALQPWPHSLSVPGGCRALATGSLSQSPQHP